MEAVLTLRTRGWMHGLFGAPGGGRGGETKKEEERVGGGSAHPIMCLSFVFPLSFLCLFP